MLYYIESINIYEIYTGAPLHGFNDWLQALTPFKAEAASCAVLKLNATLGRATHEAGCHEFYWIWRENDEGEEVEKATSILCIVGKEFGLLILWLVHQVSMATGTFIDLYIVSSVPFNSQEVF